MLPSSHTAWQRVRRYARSLDSDLIVSHPMSYYSGYRYRQTFFTYGYVKKTYSLGLIQVQLYTTIDHKIYVYIIYSYIPGVHTHPIYNYSSEASFKLIYSSKAWHSQPTYCHIRSRQMHIYHFFCYIPHISVHAPFV